MKRALLFATTLTACISSSSVTIAEEIYKWVDEAGVVHYGEHPPKNQVSETLRTKTGHSSPTTYNKTTEKQLKRRLFQLKVHSKMSYNSGNYHHQR